MCLSQIGKRDLHRTIHGSLSASCICVCGRACLCRYVCVSTGACVCARTHVHERVCVSESVMSCDVMCCHRQRPASDRCARGHVCARACECALTNPMSGSWDTSEYGMSETTSHLKNICASILTQYSVILLRPGLEQQTDRLVRYNLLTLWAAFRRLLLLLQA